MRIDKNLVRRLIRESIRGYLLSEADVGEMTRRERLDLGLVEADYDKAKIAYVLGVETLVEPAVLDDSLLKILITTVDAIIADSGDTVEPEEEDVIVLADRLREAAD